MNRGVVSRLLFLVLPVIAITGWFLYDGGISFGWNFIYYWMWIIGFLVFYEVALITNAIFSRDKNKRSHVNLMFLIIVAIVLLLSVFYFIANM